MKKTKFPVDILKYDEMELSFMTYDECDQKHGNNNFEQYISLKLVVSHALSKYRARIRGRYLFNPSLPTNNVRLYLLIKEGLWKLGQTFKKQGFQRFDNC